MNITTRITNNPPAARRRRRGASGATLMEVVMALMVAAVAMAGTVAGYILAASRAEWSAFSLAANSLAMMRMEQARAAKWDTQAQPPVDQLEPANFPVETNVLDIPISGTNVVYATNFTTITTLSTDPPLKMIRVDCVWPFARRGPFTNTMITYRAPDQ